MQINYQKQIYSIVSHHDLNKSIITTCISKYENAYMLYHDFNIYFIFSIFKTITFHWERVNLNYVPIGQNKDKVSLKYLPTR